MTDQPNQVAIDVKGLIASMSPREMPLVAPQARLIEDLGYDSLALIELAVAIENRFGIDAISDEQAMGIATVGDLESLVLDVRQAAVD